MNTTNLGRVSVLTVIALAAARCLSVFDRLPARMMTHFDAAGRANGFMPRADFFLLYALLSLGAVLLLLLVPLLPVQLANVPNRDYWTAPEHRAELRAKLVGFSTLFAAGISLFLAWVLEQVLESNLEQHPLHVWKMHAALGGLGVGVLLMIVWLARAFRVPQQS